MLLSWSISFGTNLCSGERKTPSCWVETNYWRTTTDFPVGKSTSLISNSRECERTWCCKLALLASAFCTAKKILGWDFLITSNFRGDKIHGGLHCYSGLASAKNLTETCKNGKMGVEWNVHILGMKQSLAHAPKAKHNHKEPNLFSSQLVSMLFPLVIYCNNHQKLLCKRR